MQQILHKPIMLQTKETIQFSSNFSISGLDLYVCGVFVLFAIGLVCVIYVAYTKVCFIISITILSLHGQPSSTHTKLMLFFHVVVLVFNFKTIMMVIRYTYIFYIQIHCIIPLHIMIIILSYSRYVCDFDKNSNEVLLLWYCAIEPWHK